MAIILKIEKSVTILIPIAANFGTLMIIGPLHHTDRIQASENRGWRTAAILKVEKPRYRRIIIDHRQIWYDDAF